MKCSIVMTVHDEQLLLKPTFDALVTSHAYLASRGGEAELIVVADNADATTKDVAAAFAKAGQLPVRIVETSFGEPGPARNVGVQNAAFDIIAIHDGDEMVCESWFYAALQALGREASQGRTKSIAHSHWSLVFGRESFWWGHPESDGPILKADDFELSNPWSVQCVAPKQAFIDVPYRAYRPSAHFEYEDWFWNAEVAWAGYRHFRVRDTVHGVRRKEMSRDLKAQLNRKVLDSTRQPNV